MSEGDGRPGVEKVLEQMMDPRAARFKIGGFRGGQRQSGTS